MNLWQRYWTIFFRCCRLRCPRCGEQPMFVNLISMHPRCQSCGLKYERGPGYFLGSIYINYGLTTIFVTVTYFILNFGYEVPVKPLLAGLVAFIAIFPLWFFRYSRCYWAGMDQLFDPGFQANQKTGLKNNSPKSSAEESSETKPNKSDSQT